MRHFGRELWPVLQHVLLACVAGGVVAIATGLWVTGTTEVIPFTMVAVALLAIVGMGYFVTRLFHLRHWLALATPIAACNLLEGWFALGGLCYLLSGSGEGGDIVLLMAECFGSGAAVFLLVLCIGRKWHDRRGFDVIVRNELPGSAEGQDRQPRPTRSDER